MNVDVSSDVKHGILPDILVCKGKMPEGVPIAKHLCLIHYHGKAFGYI